MQFVNAEKLDYAYLSAKDEQFWDKLESNDKKTVIIDDFQNINNDSKKISEFIAKSDSETRFYILSRTRLPAALKPYYTTGQLIEYEETFFELDEIDIQEYAKLENIALSKKECKQIKELTNGWFINVIFLLKAYGKNINIADMQKQAFIDICDYADVCIFDMFEDEIKNFLILMGHLDEFNERMAQIICTQHDMKEIIENILTVDSIITCDNQNSYRFTKFFGMYLKYKQEKELTKSRRQKIFNYTGLYYALEDNIPEALKWFSLAENSEKVAEILIKQSKMHVGVAYYMETSQYYLSLPDDIIKNSAELMTGMSMLYSLMCRPQESEQYLSYLEDYEKKLAHDSKQKKTAKELILYLKIALPHRDSTKMNDFLKNITTIIAQDDLKIPQVSVTGNMPSLINGGVDLCELTKNDRVICKALKIPCELIFREKGRGTLQIGLGESLFEKNHDDNFTEELTLLSEGYVEARTAENQQLIFAVTAVTARIYATMGKISQAKEIINKFLQSISRSERLHPNVKAFICHLDMISGKTDKVKEWYRDDAPDEFSCFYITDRYLYITKIKCYIMFEMYEEALSLLKMLETYFVSYKRNYLQIEALTLKSIIYYRKGDKKWQDCFCKAVKLASKYKYIRVISKYGIAVLDISKSSQPKVSEKYYKNLKECIQRQAINYPNYLKSCVKQEYNLTKTEKQMLKLICDGLSNAEISDLLNIAERTVKFHLSNIYKKLNVGGRIDAINLCLENEMF